MNEIDRLQIILKSALHKYERFYDIKNVHMALALYLKNSKKNIVNTIN
jgi:hypothetical protein